MGNMVGTSDLVQSTINQPRRFEGGTRAAFHAALCPPLLAVIVVVFRDRDELAALIDNISPFRGADVELVVIDGGSDDGTLELLQARNNAVDYWLSEPDRGIYEAMNKGIAAARGQYILHLNAGDRLLALPYELLRTCAVDGIDVVCCRVLENEGRVFTPRVPWLLRLYNTWHHQGTFYRRVAHLGYDPKYRIFGDFEHNQRMLIAGKSLRQAGNIVSEHCIGGVSADKAALQEMYRAIRTHFGWCYTALAFARFKLSGLLQRFHKHPPSLPQPSHLSLDEPVHPSGSKKDSVSVVIVTHNSEAFISKLVEALETQTQPPDLVVVIDSGSSNPQYLDRARKSHLPFVVALHDNIGFAKACNIGWDQARDHDFTLFLNPDAFLTPEYLKSAVNSMEEEQHNRVGILTGTLLGYDIAQGLPTGLVDSTGIQQTWFGRFYDRDQGEPLSVLHRYNLHPNPVRAICGAAMFARQTALSAAARNGSVFQSDYFMYKEDIELSLRMAGTGWSLLHDPRLTAFHCRGWKSRKSTSKEMRVLSAKNEIRMHYSNRSPFVILSILKLCLVRAFNI
jgi:GT2 family glycosyltransferase